MTSPPPKPLAIDDTSMQDMLRIMDVASALRRERETAEDQLDVAAAKARLRERLLATAAAAGENVTAEEIDVAIEEYFRRQHRYEDPPRGWGTFWAHVWVMRRPIALFAGAIAIGTATVITLLLLAPKGGGGGQGQPSAPTTSRPAAGEPASPHAPVPPPVDPIDAAQTAFAKLRAAASALAADDDAKARVARVATAGESALAARDATRLQAVTADLQKLHDRLDEEYVVTIVSRQGEQSGVDRYSDGKLSGLYLIVEAVTPDGKQLRRAIRNAETGRTDLVTKWGELVPQAVWDRVVADKQADGVIDEAEFARKERGVYDERVSIRDGGAPLRRGRQITQW